MLSVVIPYTTEGCRWNELQYAVRSIAMNLKEDINLFLVSEELPKWAKNITLLKHHRTKGKYSKVRDSWEKMKLIVNSDIISEEFIYWYDDVYLLMPIFIDFWNTVYSNGIITGMYANTKNVYRSLLHETYLIFKDKNTVIYNYETHLPRLFSKTKMRELIAIYEPSDKKLLASTLYFNHFYKEKSVILNKNDNIKAGFFGKESFDSFNTPDTWKACIMLIEKKMFLNHNDAGLNDGLKQYIMRKFNNKSKFEK